MLPILFPNNEERRKWFIIGIARSLDEGKSATIVSPTLGSAYELVGEAVRAVGKVEVSFIAELDCPIITIVKKGKDAEKSN